MKIILVLVTKISLQTTHWLNSVVAISKHSTYITAASSSIYSILLYVQGGTKHTPYTAHTRCTELFSHAPARRDTIFRKQL